MYFLFCRCWFGRPTLRPFREHVPFDPQNYNLKSSHVAALWLGKTNLKFVKDWGSVIIGVWAAPGGRPDPKNDRFPAP